MRLSGTRIVLVALVLVAHGIGAGTSVLAQDTGPRRSLRLDSRYLTGANSNAGLAGFGVDILDLAEAVADAGIPDGDPGRRFLWWNGREATNVATGLLTFVSSAILGGAFTHAYHEFGHGTRLAALGYRPYYGHGSAATVSSCAAVPGSPGLHASFFGYFLSSLTNQSGFTIACPGARPLTSTDPSQTPEWGTTIAGAGLNNEMFFTEALEDGFHRDGSHLPPSLFPVP